MKSRILAATGLFGCLFTCSPGVILIRRSRRHSLID
jgi:hypothetical protein